ncbi:unnamed protein product [Effrenium voratum]|uniref:NAD-dependent epimerase/dehydratase domain-containing protein n=1 Tax=Effrenium voratum TaxID=2562239 RepID=A0AA36N978_9DINO|nr:unnamed protein product [Effrenium voratum]
MAPMAPSAPPPRSQKAEFVLAGLAACGAITATNPVDVVKTRLQLQGELKGAKASAYTGILQAMGRIFQKEGLRGLQRGLCAAYLLQFSNVGCRFGCYGYLKQLFQVRPGESTGAWLSAMGLGLASGALAGLVSNPFFLLKSRFQAAGSEDVMHQHSHPSLRSAFREIGKAQGIAGYYRGLSAFVPRVAVATSAQLSTYDVSKEFILRRTEVKEGVATHFGASLMSGLAVTLAMQPFDIVAVRLMNQPATGVPLYTGPLDCGRKMLSHEGLHGSPVGGDLAAPPAQCALEMEISSLDWMALERCVTGGSGFLGSWCIKLLLEEGYTVHTTTRSAEKASYLRKLPGAERLKIFDGVDLLSPGAFDAAIQGCVAVLHTASPFYMKGGSEEKLVTPAVEGTRNVLDTCRRLGVKRVALTSSTASVYANYGTLPTEHVYSAADWSPAELLREKENWYCLSKVKAEERGARDSRLA